MIRSPRTPLSRRAFVAGLAAAGATSSLRQAVAASPAAHEIVIRGFKVQPANLTVRPGDRIRWVNLDIVPHTATADDGRFDSGSLAENVAWELTVSEPGRIPYYCVFHPNMRGEIRVEPGSETE